MARNREERSGERGLQVSTDYKDFVSDFQTKKMPF
jgi:hypothetical protein